MNLVRRQISQTAVMMLVIVPGKKLSAELVRVLVTAKSIGKFGTVLQGLELALGVRIVV